MKIIATVTSSLHVIAMANSFSYEDETVRILFLLSLVCHRHCTMYLVAIQYLFVINYCYSNV